MPSLVKSSHILLITLAATLGLQAELILNDDFQHAPTGTLAPDYLITHWQAHVINGVTDGRVSVVEEDDGNRFIRVTYPEGQISPPNSGAQWNRLIRHPVDEAVAEYRVRFDADFDWTNGGKLPGLTGGTSATGGKPDPNGFSSRYMWRKDGNLVVYLYHSEQKGRFGDDLPLGKQLLLPAGGWHTLKQHVKLNTAGKPDGVLQVWVDGKLLLDRHDLRWRLAGQDWGINHFLFSTFHGGSSDAYRPARTNHIDFDDFTVTLMPAGESAE